MQEEDELRKEIAEKKKIMEKEFGSAPMNEQQFKGKRWLFFRCTSLWGYKKG